MTIFGPVGCSPKQGRVDGCQLRSGRGSRAYNSSEGRPKAEHWPSSSNDARKRVCVGGEAPYIATLKVGGGSGAAPPTTSDDAQPSVLTCCATPAGCRLCLIACNTRQPDEVGSLWG